MTATEESGDEAGVAGAYLARPVLAVVWARAPELVGAILSPNPSGARSVFGRGGLLAQQRPGNTRRNLAIDDPGLSREQLEISADAGAIRIANIGKRALLDVTGVPTTELALELGDVCEVKGQVVFVCIERPEEMAPLRNVRALPKFGQPDAQGYVGESVLAHRLRDHIAFLAARNAHVAILGPSGSGKELAVRGIHKLSARAKKPLVSRSAATFPAALIEAELFGNQENYPQSGMPSRPGLVGEADGGTLFLDEIGELSDELQTRLLRFLDEGGEYQRLGESRRRSANVRFVAATNRPLSSLKHDLAARLKLRLSLPGLNERREDIPLIARHLLAVARDEDADIAARFFENGEPRVSASLMRRLVAHMYQGHVRELDALLWSALSTSEDATLDLTSAVEQELTAPPASMDKRGAPITREDVLAALERTSWVHERAWRELGLANRHVLKRLVKKLGITKSVE